MVRSGGTESRTALGQGRSANRRDHSLGAFTLVELLVVITIIGVLVGLLVVGIGQARVAVNRAAVTSEVAGLENALRSFKTQFQASFPPDFAVNDGSNNRAGVNEREINQFLSQIFRYRDTTYGPGDVAIDYPTVRLPDGSIAVGNFNNLDISEALYLWLRGFSNNPEYPLAGAPINPNNGQTWIDPDKVERTPLFEFKKDRLRDDDGDGFLEYYPRGIEQLPYLYFVNYRYKTMYNTTQMTIGPQFRVNTSNLSLRVPAPRPYMVKLPPANLNLIDKTYFASSDTCQILTAGLDGNFGEVFDTSNVAAYIYPTGPYSDTLHRDNITNFAEGSLESKLP